MRTAFGEFILDSDQRRLLAGAREVRVSPKAFDLLQLLLQNRPKAMTKDELFSHLWPDTFVTENNLATLIADLRSALHDSAQSPQFIRTVYGYGYAFAGEAIAQPPGPVAAPPVAPSVDVIWKVLYEHKEIPLQPGDNIFGRSGPGVIVIESPTISRHHASIRITRETALVEDLGSKNGTYIGNTQVTTPVGLRDGDELRLGSVVLIVRFRSRGPSTETIGSST